MTALARGARHLSWRSPPAGAPDLASPIGQRRGGLATIVALAALAPVWLPRPLLMGEFSLTFAVPFVLALWALTQPAWPGSVRRAIHGGQGRGLWLELLCVGAAVIMALLSMLVSPDPLRAFRVIIPMAYAVCALILLTRVSPQMQRRLLLGLLLSGAVVLGLALLLAQTGPGRAMVMRDYRFLAFFENPNQLGIMVLTVWPLAIALLLNARTTRLRLLCTATTLILAGAIFMSGTKTALALGFVAGALIWLYHASRSGSLDKTIFKLVIVLCVIVIAVPAILWVLSWVSPAFFRRVDTILTNGVWQFASMQTRDVIWKMSIEIGLDNPWLGEGAGTRVYNYSHSHNMFADYFRGMGVFGLAAAVVLVGSAVGRGATFLFATLGKGQAGRPSDTIIAALYLGAIFYLIGNQLSDSFSPTTAFLFWMLYFGAYLAALPDRAVAGPDRHRARPRSTREWTPRATRAGATARI